MTIHSGQGQKIPNHIEARELAEIVANAVQDFREGMETNQQFDIRIGRRATQIICFGMTGLAVLGAILFYLVSVLTSDFSKVTGQMEIRSDNMRKISRPMDFFLF